MNENSTQGRATRPIVERELSQLRYVAQRTRKMMTELAEFERQLGASIEELEQVKSQVDCNDNPVVERTVVTLPIRDVIGRAPVKELMTQLQVAQALSVSRTTLWKMRKEGRLPPQIRVSDRRVAYRRADVEDWIERGGSGGKRVESELSNRESR
jgi:predicted DNA-binding transcriptional regulator AlpA